ncbi:hypothetical protein ACFQ3Z_13295 [Streptomyces nogalater]
MCTGCARGARPGRVRRRCGRGALRSAARRARAGAVPGLGHGPGAGDARLELPGRTRGFVWINGFCLGRYWSAGPQRSLYVPGPVLREGGNEIWVLDLDEGPDPPAPRLLPV